MKTVNILWSLSLIIIGICTVISAGANILRIDMSDIIIRIVGIIVLIALPILAYTTVRKIKNGKK